MLRRIALGFITGSSSRLRRIATSSLNVKESISSKANDKSRVLLMLKFKHCFSLESEKDAFTFIDQHKSLLKAPIDAVSRNIEFLFEKDVRTETIMQNRKLNLNQSSDKT